MNKASEAHFSRIFLTSNKAEGVLFHWNTYSISVERLTCAAGLYRTAEWRRHPGGTGESERGPKFVHWTGTWVTSILYPLSFLFIDFNNTVGWLTAFVFCADSPFMVVVHEGRHWADLHSVGVIGWVLKESIIRVKELTGHQEEELPRWATVVQPDWQRKTHKQGELCKSSWFTIQIGKQSSS